MRCLLSAVVMALLSFSASVLAQPAKTPEQLLSADCLVYFRYDGYEPHKKAYDQTALAQAMKEGLSDFFDHAIAQFGASMPSSLVIRMRIASAMGEASHCCNRERRQRELRHIRNSLAICSRSLCQFLLRVRRLTIGQVGMAGFPG